MLAGAMLFLLSNVALHYLPEHAKSAGGADSARGVVGRGIRERGVKAEQAVHRAKDVRQRCRAEFPLKCDMYPYVRYWNRRFYPEDCHVSPLRPNTSLGQRYVVFEPDIGGFDDQRMAFETVALFAHATGRTLVLPQGRSSFAHFDLDKLSEALSVIPMQRFLQEVAGQGLLKIPLPGTGPGDPGDVSVASRALAKDLTQLGQYLQQACYSRQWSPSQSFVSFNLTSSAASAASHRQAAQMLPHRTPIPYDLMQHERAIFFPSRASNRLLVNFYSYLYWADPHLDRVYKRIARDRLRYADDIFCSAGGVVKLLHQQAALVGGRDTAVQNDSDSSSDSNVNFGATYHAFHIRRGDFIIGFPEMAASGQEIWDFTQHLLDPHVSRLIYIATNEPDRDFFKPFMQAPYTVRFLDELDENFPPPRLRGNVDINANGRDMIAQIVCANAHTFIGTPLSTFTNYITRLRGYYRDGRYAHTYLWKPNVMYSLQTERDLGGATWEREYSIAAVDIDDAVGTAVGATPQDQAAHWSGETQSQGNLGNSSDADMDVDVGGMSCRAVFPLKCDMYSYVRYWNRRFYPEDCYISPLRPVNASWAQQKYLVFEPDVGGWNNKRMALETTILLAHATGRTLVIPPRITLTRLVWNEENPSTYETFLDFGKLAEGLNMITMDQFLENVAKPGLLRAPYPSNLSQDELSLHAYLEKACGQQQWNTQEHFIGLNITSNSLSFDSTQTSRRYRQMGFRGRRVIPYDAKMHSETALYVDQQDPARRLLTTFYNYLYWADVHLEQVYRRLVRDRLRYADDIFCAAGRVVRLLHQDAAGMSNKPVQSASRYDRMSRGGDTSQDATYFAYHLRRDDFQRLYSIADISGAIIWNNTHSLLDPSVSQLIYISTDEKDMSFFNSFRRPPFTLKFLRDYAARAGLQGVDPNKLGMIEQIICANAHTFVGTLYSTFTSYITRLRGYYRDGRYERTFYTLPLRMYDLQKARPLVGPHWAREFEKAHRDIDDWSDS